MIITLLLIFLLECGVHSFYAPPFRFIRSNENVSATSSTIAVRKQAATDGTAVLETTKFLDAESARDISNEFGTPCYVYDENSLRENAEKCLNFPNSFGLTVRFAMKSSPNAAILKLFDSLGLHIDASSGWEVHRALLAGISASKISLSTQELPHDFETLLREGVLANACSLNQIELIGKAFRGHRIGLRVNPGLGSGGTQRTNVGGPGSSFGIWHEQLGEAEAILKKFDLIVERIHTHIGSGSDPAVWQRVSGMSLDLMKRFSTATTLNLGGGYKVGRMSYEKSTDLTTIGSPVKEDFIDFEKETGRKLHLEIEPGTFLMANACTLLCRVQDVVSTSGPEGHAFIKLDAGMTDLLRPSLYGAQHPIVILPKNAREKKHTKSYVVVGHCCESGDILTPASGQPDVIDERELLEAHIGDLCAIEGCGAYVSAMCTKNYNSFPEAPEIFLSKNGSTHLIRKRQTLEQIIQNEVDLPEM